MIRWISAIICAAIGSAVVVIAMTAMVFRSSSSTAALGFLLIPFVVIPLAVVFLVFGYCLPDLLESFQRSSEPRSNGRKVRAAIAALMAAGGIGFLAYGLMFTTVVNQARTISEPKLRQFLDNSMWRRNRFALGALAENPNVSPQMLDEVAHFSDPLLHERMSSVWPVMGDNTRGLAVMRLIARNPKVWESTLVHLSQSPDGYVRDGVVLNPKTPTAIIRELAMEGDSEIEMGLAQNPNTPSDLLSHFAASTSEYTRSAIARNPSTPVETLEKLASDPEPLVRRDAALNPNTPLKSIARLANDPDERVRLGVKVRGNYGR